MRRSGLICLARSSRTGLDMSHILFMVEIQIGRAVQQERVAIQGSNVPNPDEAVPSSVSGAMAKAGKGLLEGTLQAGTSAVSDKLLDLVGLGGKSAADKGKDTRDYLAAAFPELNAWERAGADASSAGMVDAGFENQKELTKMQLDNQKEIAEMQNETQKEIAGIQSATSRQNTKDQVYAQNEMLAY